METFTSEEGFDLSIITRQKKLGVEFKADPLKLGVGCKAYPGFLAIRLTLRSGRKECTVLDNEP